MVLFLSIQNPQAMIFGFSSFPSKIIYAPSFPLSPPFATFIYNSYFLQGSQALRTIGARENRAEFLGSVVLYPGTSAQSSFIHEKGDVFLICTVSRELEMKSKELAVSLS